MRRMSGRSVFRFVVPMALFAALLPIGSCAFAQHSGGYSGGHGGHSGAHVGGTHSGGTHHGSHHYSGGGVTMGGIGFGIGFGGMGFGGLGYSGLGYSSSRYGVRGYPYSSGFRYGAPYVNLVPSYRYAVPSRSYRYASPPVTSRVVPSTAPRVWDGVSDLKPGMVLPDGAMVISVGPSVPVEKASSASQGTAK